MEVTADTSPAEIRSKIERCERTRSVWKSQVAQDPADMDCILLWKEGKKGWWKGGDQGGKKGTVGEGKGGNR